MACSPALRSGLTDATLLRQGELPVTEYALDEGAVKLVYSDSDGEGFVLDIREAPPCSAEHSLSRNAARS